MKMSMLSRAGTVGKESSESVSLDSGPSVAVRRKAGESRSCCSLQSGLQTNMGPPNL